MKAHEFDSRKLDVPAFARDAAELRGEWSPMAMSRLADSAAAETPAATWPAVQWSLRGERREASGAAAQTWLHLEASAVVSLTCQRCLQPVQESMQLERSYRFVRDEKEAAELDIDSEEEVLALTRSLDVLDLVEDELLLSLPLVPRHETCPQPLQVPADVAELSEQEAAASERPNPFAALAALKKKQ